MIVGIDIGSTTTKAVVMKDNKLLTKMKVKASDSVTSATGVLGRITVEHDIEIGDIQKINITGAGALKIHKNIFNIPTKKIEEINAIGHGGKFLSGKDDIVIANIGTGTAMVENIGGKISHLGGTAVGGGTLVGLAKLLLNTSDFKGIVELAEKGTLNSVDLLIGDIVEKNISFLNMEDTASNFGKILDTASKEDIALGLINMIYQVIGMIAVFAAQSRNKDIVVVTGNGSHNLLGQNVLNKISEMYGIKYEFPQDAEYATAIGAALL